MDGILGRIVAIVLGLLALVGIAYAGYNGFQNHKAGVVATNITQLITNARAGFSQGNNGYTNFTTSNIASMITGGMFPSDMVRGTALVDPWGNAVTLASANNGSQGVITFGGGNGQTAKQCVSAALGLKDYVTLAVGSTTFNQTNLPDQATAGAACSATATFTLTFQ
ncbi:MULTISPECIES: prepilin type IV pili [unclassified Cupriavidus]|uniref:prepilin type IV pili n=1 Tax=unclassified Cupriavidus TaxID=2640874 RepID=UPI001AE24A32|nr:MULTISPECIES: prepilin type IV pili [unclassified Cupriavidus]MBP0633140.1 prepilin type IV pili [Cupriavidus sp. AcVe19-1a]MBP0639780.1 prepilin type IV pili [Cupriavidus sp. AcVe19-6a]